MPFSMGTAPAILPGGGLASSGFSAARVVAERPSASRAAKKTD
jgi:hypothetical protein